MNNDGLDMFMVAENSQSPAQRRKKGSRTSENKLQETPKKRISIDLGPQVLAMKQRQSSKKAIRANDSGIQEVSV